MKFHTNLPPTECLKRLESPVSNSPVDIKEIISTKYSDYLNDSQVGYQKGKRICTSVHDNYYEIFVRRWFTEHFDDSSENIMTRFDGEIFESGTGGSIVEFRLRKCRALFALFGFIILWIILLSGFSLTGQYTKPDCWFTILAFSCLTFAVYFSGIKQLILPLEFIKDLLEIGKGVQKDTSNYPLPAAPASVNTITYSSNNIFAGKLRIIRLTTILPISECLERIRNPVEFDPIHKSDDIKKKYKAYFMSEKQVAEGKCVHTKVDGCNFEMFIKTWGISSASSRYRTHSSPYEMIHTPLLGRVSAGVNSGSVIEYFFRFSENAMSYSLVFGLCWIVFMVLWYYDGCPKPVLWLSTLCLASVGIIYKLLNNRRVLSCFIKDLLEVKDTTKVNNQATTRLKKTPKQG